MDYEKAVAEVILFNNEDVIVTSGYTGFCYVVYPGTEGYECDDYSGKW